MSGTSAEFTLTLPISEQAFWTIALLFGLVVLSALIAWGLPKSKGGALSPIDNICERLGLSHGFGPLVLLAVCVAMALGAAGLFTLVDFMKAALHMPPYHQVNDGAAIRNIGLVLAALLGAPFVIWRSYVAAKQARIQDEALFNDKINAAAADLSARRQVTRVVHHGTENEDILTEWQDDLVKRAAAIDRLEGLANERPNAIRRIALQLSIYVRELSREYPPETAPSHEDMNELTIWAQKLKPVRPDMESAVQTLGRLRSIPNHGLREGDIDLRRANLQGFDLQGLIFDSANCSEAHIQGADMQRVQMQEADLSGAQMSGVDLSGAQMQEADLNSARLQGAFLSVADMQGAFLTDAQMQGAFLTGAHIQGADLDGAQMQGVFLSVVQMQGADLDGASMQGAFLFRTQMDDATALKDVTLQGAALREVDSTSLEHLKPFWWDVFADGSAQLPEGETRPDHWVDEKLKWVEFEKRWKAWQATLPED